MPLDQRPRQPVRGADRRDCRSPRDQGLSPRLRSVRTVPADLRSSKGSRLARDAECLTLWVERVPHNKGNPEPHSGDQGSAGQGPQRVWCNRLLEHEALGNDGWRDSSVACIAQAGRSGSFSPRSTNGRFSQPCSLIISRNMLRKSLRRTGLSIRWPDAGCSGQPRIISKKPAI